MSIATYRDNYFVIVREHTPVVMQYMLNIYSYTVTNVNGYICPLLYDNF